MHIGINSYFLGQETTGSGQYLAHLLDALLALEGDEQYTLLLPDDGRDHALPTGLEGAYRLHAPLGNENLAKAWLEQVAFPRACKATGVDLAHVPHFASPLYPTVPTVVTIHDLIPLVLPAYRGDLRVRLYMRLVALAARRATAILTDSQASERDIIRVLGLSPERIHVVYLAADPGFGPQRNPAAIQELRERYNLPERFILYLGGLDQRRNLHTLLAALRQAIQILSDRQEADLPTLVLAGGLPRQDTPLTPDPLRMARELGIARWVQAIGRIPEADKAALYSHADIFAFPSSYEGFGLPPLEAMACGVPVLAANATSLPEIVGDGGVLVETLDVRAWAQALVALWTDPERRRQLAQQAVKQSARFSWAKAADETRQVYREAWARAQRT